MSGFPDLKSRRPAGASTLMIDGLVIASQWDWLMSLKLLSPSRTTLKIAIATFCGTHSRAPNPMNLAILAHRDRAPRMKKVVSGGPANRTALREPCRPFRYNPVELSRFAGAGLFGI
jgi:hypothetical protein